MFPLGIGGSNKTAGEFLGFPEIPEDRIAQSPEGRRDAARLMVLRRSTGRIEHRIFGDLPELFSAGDALVLNDARVIPARLVGRKSTGGRVVLLLLKRRAAAGREEVWTSLATPRPRPGLEIKLDGGLSAKVLGPSAAPSYKPGRPLAAADGEYEILFSRPVAPELERIGKMPLPPYIRRKACPPEIDLADREDYQTVFSSLRTPPADGRPHALGAVAAPTAGLHFTPDVLDRLRGLGVTIVTLTLQVGWGTFRPVSAPNYRDHRMLAEEFILPTAAAQAVNVTRERGGAVWACGTTAVRVLESRADERGVLSPGAGETDLFITPGHRFRVVDKLITNFHLPRHTPLLLAAAFAGPDFLRSSYREALAKSYRFLSYGDAMAIL